MENNNTPITKKEEVQKSNDNRIDEDFKGFPHAPSNENIIQPKTQEDKYNANLEENADTDLAGNKKSNDEMQSDGSASAFEGTENMFDDDEKDALSKK